MNAIIRPEYGLEPGLRFATILDGRGGATNGGWAEIRRWQPEEGVLWVHLERDDPTAQAWVREESGLDPVAAEALLAEETRPRVEAVNDGLLIVLRGISKIGAGAESTLGGDIDFVPIHLWVESNRVISLRDQNHQLNTLREIHESLGRGRGPSRPGELLALIASKVIADIEPVLDVMDDEIDDLEDKMLENVDAPPEITGERDVRRQLSQLRRKAIHLRRYLTPQRDALYRLSREECTWFAPRDRVLLREDIDRLLRFIEYLDAIRDRAIILHEDLSALVSERIAFSSNKISRTSNRLTLLAALLLPPSLAAGFLGMNVGGIPWNTDPNGFMNMMLVGGGCSVLVLSIIWLFRWL